MPDISATQIDNLPDVTTLTLPEQKYFDGLPFPLILTPTVADRSSADWQQWVRANLEALKSTLIKYGAILFRGFPMDTPEDFDLFAKSYGWAEFPYVGGVSVRSPIVGNVYTSTEAPPDRKIPFHHEIAHAPDYPKVCSILP